MKNKEKLCLLCGGLINKKIWKAHLTKCEKWYENAVKTRTLPEGRSW